VKRFVETAIERAGLSALLEARRAGDMTHVRATATSWGASDLMVLGAIADQCRSDGVGGVVRIHDRRDAEVTWVDPSPGASELDVLRAVAVARIASDAGARIGIDWSRHGLELAQVALGFGASDLVGPVTRKNGLPILADEKQKVKGQGMVDVVDLKRKEIAALVTHAGRVPVFTDAVRGLAGAAGEVAGAGLDS